MLDAGIGKKDIDPTELIQHLVDRLGRLADIGNIEWQLMRIHALAAQGFSRLAKRGRIPAVQNHRGTQQPQRLGCRRSEEHTSELQSLIRLSYAVFCLQKKTKNH